MKKFKAFLKFLALLLILIIATIFISSAVLYVSGYTYGKYLESNGYTRSTYELSENKYEIAYREMFFRYTGANRGIAVDRMQLDDGNIIIVKNNDISYDDFKNAYEFKDANILDKDCTIVLIDTNNQTMYMARKTKDGRYGFGKWYSDTARKYSESGPARGEYYYCVNCWLLSLMNEINVITFDKGLRLPVYQKYDSDKIENVFQAYSIYDNDTWGNFETQLTAGILIPLLIRIEFIRDHKELPLVSRIYYSYTHSFIFNTYDTKPINRILYMDEVKTHNQFSSYDNDKTAYIAVHIGHDEINNQCIDESVFQSLENKAINKEDAYNIILNTAMNVYGMNN